MRLTPAIALAALLGLTAGCQQTPNATTGQQQDVEIPKPSEVVTGAAGKALIPAETMAQRRLRAAAGAAVLGRVAADRASREPDNQGEIHSSLMALRGALDRETSKAWPNLALRDVRISIYSAMLSGSKQRVTDYIGAVLSPRTVLSGLRAAGLDVSTYAAMQSDIACHFAGLPDAPKGAASECPITDPPQRSPDELRKVYRTMLDRQIERLEGMVGA